MLVFLVKSYLNQILGFGNILDDQNSKIIPVQVFGQNDGDGTIAFFGRGNNRQIDHAGKKADGVDTGQRKKSC
jgi:hypothetical protein